MNHKARRYITIYLTAALCACVFSAAVFAEAGTQTDPEGTPASSQASSEASESSLPSVRSSEPFVPAKIQVTLVYDNGEQTEVKIVDIGTTVAALPTPSRKGYRFSGWASGGGVLSSSHALNRDIVLTAKWAKIAQSSAARSSTPPRSSSQKPVDTRQSEVEAIASQADQATSDPDALSSQNWGELLSSPSDSSGASSGNSEVSSSTDQTDSGGASWLLPVGLLLIALALGGIGLFVYLQFFSGRGGKGPRGGGKGPGGRIDEHDDTMVFTDVSSFSNPAEHAAPGRSSDLEDTIPIGPARKAPLPSAEKPVPRQSETPRKLPQEPRRPLVKPEEKPLSPLSQAKPATPKEGKKNDFDWEQFFQEDDDLPRRPPKE